MAARSDYALPFALLTVGGLLAYSGFKGKSITAVLGGDIGNALNPAGGSAPVPTGGDSSGGDSASDSGGGPADGSGTVTYPLASKGKIIGTPGVGTHSYSAAPNNWQSDRAVDIAVPMGTSVYAVADGKIVRLGGSWGGLNTGAINGLNVTIQTADGNEWFYTHLMSRANIKVGDTVKAGQFLGKSGGANGVEHLHIGVMKGDIMQLLGVSSG